MSLKIIIPLLLACVLCVNGAVDESSGSMILNIPLCSVKSSTVSLDLNLTYSSGIQINQHASWVGLGFNINLPYVEHIPLGSADEQSGEYAVCADHFRAIEH